MSEWAHRIERRRSRRDRPTLVFRFESRGCWNCSRKAPTPVGVETRRGVIFNFGFFIFSRICGTRFRVDFLPRDYYDCSEF